MTRGGRVVIGPPSYQKGSFVATKDYARLLRRLPALLAPGGHALLCLNAPELSMAWLNDLVREHAPGLGFVQRVPNPTVFADMDESRGLKVAAFQALAETPPLKTVAHDVQRATRGDLAAALATQDRAGGWRPESDDLP